MTMRAFALIAAALAAASPAVAGDPAIEAPIKAMMEGFNAGDIAAVKALHVAAPTILDSAAPFAFSGPDAFDQWLGEMAREEAADGLSDGVLWLGDPVDEVVSGDRAFVVAPGRYSFKQKGVAMQKTGFMTFVMAKEGAGWKIASWSWASPAAVPAP